MSSIIGIVSKRNTVPDLLHSLQQMEQASHNSCGLMVYGRQGDTASSTRLHRHRRAQPISVWLDPLKCSGSDARPDLNPLDKLEGQTGMGHTGQSETQRPNSMQAVLPQISHGAKAHLNSPAKVAVVALSQLQATSALRENLIERGYGFKSETDSELVAHLIDATYQSHPVQAMQRTLALLTGPLAMGVMFHDQPGCLFAVQRGVPLYWYSDNERTAWASDTADLPCDLSDLKVLSEGLVLEFQNQKEHLMHRLHA